MPNPQLEQLIQEYRSGSQEAASELFMLFSNDMARVASRVAQKFHSPEAIDIEGVVNSGFRSFFSAVDKPNFQSRGGEVGGLLATIVSRKALLRIRKLSRRPMPLKGDSEVLDFLLSDAANDYAERHLIDDLNELLHPILEQLTSKERAIVVAILNPFENQSFEDLADQFRTSQHSIETLWRSLQSKIRKILRQSGE